jgi:hypothetical protein
MMMKAFSVRLKVKSIPVDFLIDNADICISLYENTYYIICLFFGSAKQWL